MEMITAPDDLTAVPSDADVLASVETFLVDTGMKHTRFGRDALGEASFVKTLREGRKLTLETAGKITSFMKEYRELPVHADADTIAAPQQSHGKIGDISAPQVSA